MTPASREAVASRIKAARESHYDSQHALAEALGIGQSTICAWERGDYKPAQEKWADVADKLHTTVEELFFDAAADHKKKRRRAS